MYLSLIIISSIQLINLFKSKSIIYTFVTTCIIEYLFIRYIVFSFICNYVLCTGSNCVTKENLLSHNVELNNKDILLYYLL